MNKSTKGSFGKILEEATYHIDEQHLKKALNTLNKGLLEFEDSYELASMKAEVLILLGRTKEAKILIDELLICDPEDPYLYFFIANCHASKKDFNKAVESLKKGLKLDPRNFDLVSAIANYSYLAGKPYKEYIELGLHIDKVRMQQFLENYWIETLDVNEAIKQPQLDVRKTMNQVCRSFEEGDFDTALNGIKAVKAKGYVDKKMMDLLLMMEVDAYIGKGELKKGKETSNYMISRWPENPSGYSSLAKVEMASGNMESADKEINKAIILGEKHKSLEPHIFFTKSDILKAMGNKEWMVFYEKGEKLLKNGSVTVD